MLNLVKHELKEGTRINLTRKGNKDYVYSSQVTEVNGDKISILGPMKRGRFVYVPKGAEMKLAYTKAGRGTFHIDSVVSGSSNKGVYLLYLEITSDEVAQQDRSNFRVENRVPVELVFTDIEGMKTEKTETIDLSAGGARVYSNLDLKKDDEIMVIIGIDSGDITTKARVVRRLPSNHIRFNNVFALSFEELSKQDEDFIVKYLFDLQRLMSSEGRF